MSSLALQALGDSGEEQLTRVCAWSTPAKSGSPVLLRRTHLVLAEWAR